MTQSTEKNFLIDQITTNNATYFDSLTLIEHLSPKMKIYSCKNDRNEITSAMNFISVYFMQTVISRKPTEKAGENVSFPRKWDNTLLTLLYRNRSIDLLSKSMDWSLYDRHRYYERTLSHFHNLGWLLLQDVYLLHILEDIRFFHMFVCPLSQNMRVAKKPISTFSNFLFICIFNFVTI